MAIRSRKLFPALTAASNETIYCPDFCDPGCPYYNCPDDFYFSSPPPSAPLTPTPRPPPSSGGGLFSPSFITSLALLAGFFVLLAYYLVIVKAELGTTRPHAIGDAQMEDSSESNDLGGDQMRNSGTENMAEDVRANNTLLKSAASADSA
ncbi:hypothetical protein SAY87_022217 [Trapa incisa]|uniref:Uncharacterized protein n=1 Tax=Trapa incisa TaxID=236973 RepID=A0AAN7JV02_9MYRT|nr:hypothetical protein SAY87_022217 [Trapa incisa]